MVIQRRQTRASTADVLAQVCRPVGDELERVRQLLRRQMRIDQPELQPLSSHISRYQGKMLRPMLLLLSGKLVGQVGDRHVNLAAVVELLHQATLIHDDVLDGAGVRHRRATVCRLWGNEASVLLGDYLLSRAFDLCNRTDDPVAAGMISQTAGRICRGELLQCVMRRKWRMSEREYLDIITEKTASLYRLCCRLGGHLADGEPRQLEALGDYGQAIGCAFQITDDLLDLSGREELAGKTLGTDLALAKPTLPIIHCLQHGRESAKARLLDLLDACADRGADTDRHATDEIAALLDRAGSLEYSTVIARRFSEQAKGRLESLGESPARDAMCRIAAFVVERSC